MRLKYLTLALGALLLSVSAASAEPALVARTLHLRSGPGMNYGVIATMPGGANVDVIDCGAGWCRVAWAGTEGFAASNYLDMGGAAYAEGPPVYVGPPVYEGPVFGFGFGFGPSWGWQGHWHGGWHHGGPHHGHHHH